MIEFVKEFLVFLKVRRKLWLLPLLLVLFVIVGLLVAAKGTVVAPFIYTIF